MNFVHMKLSPVFRNHCLLLCLWLPCSPSWSYDLPAENSGDGFVLTTSEEETGNPMRAIGDINGDQIDDYAIADPFYDAPNTSGQDDRGRVYVVFGQSQAMPVKSDLISWINQGHGFIVTGSAGSKLGAAVSGNCDINGDGHSDLIISAPYSGVTTNGRPVARVNDPGVVSRSGKVYIINGHASGDAFASSMTVDAANPEANYWNTVILGEEVDDFLGVSVSCGKDLNGDNVDDIVLGSGISSAEKSLNFRIGRAYVVFGGAKFSTAVTPASSRLVLDLRAQTDTGNGSAAGSAALDPSQGIYIDASHFTQADGVSPAPDSFSKSVALLGDVNGDGIGDFAIGAPDASPDEVVSPSDNSLVEGGYKSGQVYILFGRANLAPIKIDDLLNNSQSGAYISGQASGHNLGLDLRWGGDINHDGKNDMVLGSRFVQNQQQVEQGRAYVVFGTTALSGHLVLANLATPGPGGSAQNGFIIDGVGGSSGYRVLGLSDVNGDGIDDMAISSPNITSSNRGGGGGGAFVVYGRDQTVQAFPSLFSLGILGELNNGFGFVIYGDAAGEKAGEEMAALGDINHDGLADFSVVSIKHPSQQFGIVGKIYGIYGAPNLETVEVREAHHEGAIVNRTPEPDNTLPQHTVGHAQGLLFLLTLYFIYRFYRSRKRRQAPF